MAKRIGILGGMSAESTVTYYEHITRTYTERCGDLGYPEILIYSVEFERYVEWQKAGCWDDAAAAMAVRFQALERAGADFGLIATNTMHIVFDQVQEQVRMPLLSIVDATGEAVRRAGIGTVALLGTKFTMREAFYRDGLERYEVKVVVPDEETQERINQVIYGELCRGEVREDSRVMFLDVIADLKKHGAEGVVLGCTEIPLLVRQSDCELPVFNTTVVHAQRAFEYSLAPEPDEDCRETDRKVDNIKGICP